MHRGPTTYPRCMHQMLTAYPRRTCQRQAGSPRYDDGYPCQNLCLKDSGTRCNKFLVQGDPSTSTDFDQRFRPKFHEDRLQWRSKNSKASTVTPSDATLSPFDAIREHRPALANVDRGTLLSGYKRTLGITAEALECKFWLRHWCGYS